MSKKAGPLDYTKKPWLMITVVASVVFLYLPLLVMMVFSFNDSKRTIRWEGFTTSWYGKAFSNDAWMEAFTNSLVIGLFSTILALVIGTTLAIALWRFRFPGKSTLEAFNTLPIVIPEISLGVALMLFYNSVNWPDGLAWPFNLLKIIFAHAVFAFPFVTLVVRARLVGFDRSLEEAATDLGANTWQVFRDIIIPYLKPALIAGGLLAFTLSLDDFVITFFTSDVGSTTLPVKVYSQVRMSVKPEANAIFTVLILLTAGIAITAALVLNKMQKRK